MANAKFDVANMPPLRNAQDATFDDMKTSGVINSGFSFTTGDRVIFPEDMQDTNPRKVPVGGSGKFAIYISAMLNGKPSWVPLFAFRKLPHNMKEVYKDEKFKLNRDLIGENYTDYERAEFCLGKTIDVKEKVTLKRTIYDSSTNRSKVDENDQLVLVDTEFCVFEQAQ